MSRSSPLLWLTIFLILLLPSAAGRLVLNLASGLMLALLIGPLIIAGVGWVGWRVLQANMVKCEVCGISTYKSSGQCPFCGSNLNDSEKIRKETNQSNSTIPASTATIDIKAEEAD